MTRIELITSQLIETIRMLAEEATEVNVLVSFVMKSGVRKIVPSLQKAAAKGAEIRIVTGDYLYITQPDALQMLLEELPEAEIRLFKSGGISFHPKAYLFRHGDSEHTVVGSSNLSAMALTGGVEWNVAASDSDFFDDALREFETVFYSDKTVPLNLQTLADYQSQYDRFHAAQPIRQKWSETEEEEAMFLPPSSQEPVVVEESGNYSTAVTPRPPQQEALQALEEALEEEYSSSLIVMATGLGKTYLAAFFARKFKKVLFIAHRREILEQAKASFLHVMPERSAGILDGKTKETGADMLFASVFTIGSKHHLHQFQPDEFDLIVIDEFHHAASQSYEKMRDYFKPAFLLGITATPDRMDNKDVYGICEGNVPYRIHFIEAIQKQWLAPFHYYGVYDDTDYSALTWLGSRYDEEELLSVQLTDKMARTVFESWERHKQTRTIAFCSSIRQADFLSTFFNKNGCRTVSLHSGTISISRKEAIQLLDDGKLDVIFTVDLFNEGVDIPSVDTLLFVRPTESLTVFTQQVGRGLRIAPQKTHCVIIDLIGNYRNADMKMNMFKTDLSVKSKSGLLPILPDSCMVQLDTKAIDLLKEMTKKRNPRKEQLHIAFNELKTELGRVPGYMELHLFSATESKMVKEFYRSYPALLFALGELTEKEQAIFQRYEHWFAEVEKTGMTKSYKMVLLLYMLSRGHEKWTAPVTPTEVAPFFHSYLTAKEYRKKIDLADKKSSKLINYDEKAVAKLIKEMPMTKWSGAGGNIVSLNGDLFSIGLDISKEEQQFVYGWTKEICEYRLHTYFEKKEIKTYSVE